MDVPEDDPKLPDERPQRRREYSGPASTLGLAALYARYSLKIAATNPMVWALAMGLVAAFVACGRYAQL